jgi:hypothetical protein
MSVIKNRAPRFVAVPSATVRDPELSGDLLGLLVYLLDFPADWNTSIATLVAQHRFGANSKVCNDMKRLRALGYARLTKHNDGSTEWDITSTKGVFEPDSENRNLDPNSQNRNLPNSDSHIPETGTHKQKDLETKGSKDKKQNNNAHTPARDLLQQYGITGQLATDFISHRNAKRAPITETALQGLAREAAKAGITTAHAVIVTIERNWQGFRADWHHASPAPRGTAHETHNRSDNSAVGKVRRAIAERDRREAAGAGGQQGDCDAIDGECWSGPY